jgi:hypothetical protein
MTEIEELATELATERTLHQQTMAEVERLREKTDALWWARDAQRRAKEEQRLRDLLGRLEWGGDYVNHEAPEQDCCPACGGSPVNGHELGCWLDEELRPGTPNDPAPPLEG